MQFDFEVGDTEKHTVHFERDNFSGKMVTLVDNEVVTSNKVLAIGTHVSMKLTHPYSFSVGETEKHVVRIEHIRPLFFAAFRPHTYRIFVDDVLLKEYNGY